MAHAAGTGRPPGRPRKDAQAAPVVVHVDAPEVGPKRTPAKHVKPMPAGWLGPQPVGICTDCYPDGWPKGYSGVACGHGIWTRRAF